MLARSGRILLDKNHGSRARRSEAGQEEAEDQRDIVILIRDDHDSDSEDLNL